LSFARAVGDFFLPQVCLFCGNPGFDHGRYPVCAGCLGEFVSIHSPVCPRCGMPLNDAAAPHLCGECLQDPPPFETAWSLFAYNKKARDLIHRLKFHGGLATLSIIDLLLRECIDSEGAAGEVEFVVSVPMDMKGLRRRGYNQALLIAERVAKFLHLPLDRTHLVKKEGTSPQIGLTRAQRKANIQGAFSVTGRRVFSGKAVLLVDDVYTTGATVRACSRALLKAGARSVKVLTFARVILE